MTWPTKKLGELISFEKGKKMAIADDGEPYIGIDGLRTNQYAVYTQEKNGIRCESDDVLLVWDGAHAGTVGTGLSGFVGSTIVKVLSDNSLDNKFLFYLLKLSQEKIRAAAQGAAIPHLSKAFVNSVKIPLPPLTTQKQIVKWLDKIAEAQKLNDGLIKKTEELFQSLLHKELNPVDKDWSTKRLKEICEINPSKAKINKLSANTSVSFLAMADVSESAEITNRQEKKISEVKNGFPFSRMVMCL